MRSAIRVSVVGAGNGGLAVAGYAALGGHAVTLYDIRNEALDPVRQSGGIWVAGKVEGFAQLASVTSDPKEAICDADLVILVVPGPGQGTAARDLAPYLQSGQVVLVKPGCTGGALEVDAVLSHAGLQCPVAETDSFVFACSIPEPGHSRIAAIKSSFGVAALPAAGTRAVVETVQAVLPQARAAESVLHTGLANINAVMHVAPMVANAGWIEATGGGFDFYGEGITPAVARAVEAFDEERLAVAEALHVSVPSLLAWVAGTYGIEQDTVLAAAQALHTWVFGASPAPGQLRHRYLTEDVPCGAVPTASLGAALGVPVPLHNALIHLASQLCDQDFAVSGRTMERLGLQGLDAPAIRAKVLGT